MVYLNNNQEHAFKRTSLIVVALVFMLVIACTGQTQNDPTATSAVLADTVVPTEPPAVVAVATPNTSPTPLATATALPQSTRKPGAPDTSTPEDLATSTIPPEIFDTAAVPDATPPPYHFETSAEAEKAAIELGCSGWANVTLGGINYFRSCADDSSLENPTATAEPKVKSKTEEDSIATPVFVPPATSTVAAVPAVSPTSTTVAVPESTAPAYHFSTSAEAEAAAHELGCTGSKIRVIDGVSYYRACANDNSFTIFAEGAKTTLSGQQCTLESDPTARFTEAPTDLSLVRAIVTTGSAAGGVIKPHSYLFNNDAGEGKVRVPVYAVADSFANAIAYYNTSVGTGEYLIFFDVTCEISFKYDHIAEVVPKLLAVSPATPSEGSQTTRTELIPFKAGELIGYTSGAGGVGPWDFGAYDLTFTNMFANQERYVKGVRNQSLHTVCPYEYFTEPLRSQMLAKIGTYSTFLESNPTCFTTERDVLGAASGAWFDSPELSYASATLSIALTEAYEVGITGVGSDMRVPPNDPTYLDPDLLSESHCYLVSNRWIYIEIRDEGMQLALASGTGSCPSVMPTENTIYYR